MGDYGSAEARRIDKLTLFAIREVYGVNVQMEEIPKDTVIWYRRFIRAVLKGMDLGINSNSPLRIAKRNHQKSEDVFADRLTRAEKFRETISKRHSHQEPMGMVK